MWLTRVRVEGLRAAPEIARDGMSRVHRESGGPACTGLGDGLALAAAFLDPARAPAALAALDLALPDTRLQLDELVLDEVEGLDPHGVDALVVPGPTRSITVELGLELDPPTYRTLRDLAGRDARLLTALGSGSDLSVRLGWLFNRSGTHASTAALALHVGEERFATGAADRPPWLLDLLARCGRAVYRLQTPRSEADLAAALLEASLSPVPATRAGAARARTALAGPPFHLGVVHVVQASPGRLRLALGDDLVPLRHAGPQGLAAVALAHAALVIQPDVLVADAPGDPAWSTWLGERAEGDDATLEQVVLLGAR